MFCFQLYQDLFVALLGKPFSYSCYLFANMSNFVDNGLDLGVHFWGNSGDNLQGNLQDNLGDNLGNNSGTICGTIWTLKVFLVKTIRQCFIYTEDNQPVLFNLWRQVYTPIYSRSLERKKVLAFCLLQIFFSGIRTN